MPHYRVRVQEPPSGAREVLVKADDPSSIAQALGIAPAWILSVQTESAASAGAEAGRRRRHRGRLDLRLFAQQLSVLLRAGIPLLESLETLGEKSPDATELDSVIAALREGQSLSAALQRDSQGFDPLFVAVVSASERNGQMATALADHAAYLGWTAALRARLVAAATYPLMLLAVGGAVVLFLMLYVMPRFAAVFEGLGQAVPAGSRWLLGLSMTASAHPGPTLLLGLLVALAAVWLSRSAAAGAALSAWLWSWPQLGPRLRELALARLYRCLSHLLAAGVPALQALQLSTSLLPSALRPALVAAAGDVASGLRLSQAFDRHRLATPVASRMLRVGESSGQSAAMLQQAAAFHDDEIARLTDVLVRVLNPMLMLVMGVVIGGIVVLMYLPIFTLMEQVQ